MATFLSTCFFLSASLLYPAGAFSEHQNIVQLAEAAPQLSTLVKALTAGGLTETLSGPGPFTVFAPTNEAFAKIPKDTLSKLLGSKVLLDQLLEYHVLSGKFPMRDLLKRLVTTLEKEEVIVWSLDDAIMVNNAEVTATDVGATNGVVHVINRVLVPPNFPLALYPEDVVETAKGQPDLSTLAQALVAGKLNQTLSGAGPFTVFAPTNEAFAKIPAADLQKLLANPEELDSVLKYHVLAGRFTMQDLMSVHSAKTLAGDTVHVSKGMKVNGAKIVKADVGASNGLVHIIDAVLMPPKTPVIV